MPGQPNQQQPGLVGSQAAKGVAGAAGLDTVSQMVSLHKHAGGMLDGGFLYGPYYIIDANGKTRKLSVDGNGVATWSLI